MGFCFKAAGGISVGHKFSLLPFKTVAGVMTDVLC